MGIFKIMHVRKKRNTNVFGRSSYTALLINTIHNQLCHSISEITVGGIELDHSVFNVFISKPQLKYSNPLEYKHIENAGKPYVCFAFFWYFIR